MTMNVRQAGAFTELIRKEERARRTWEDTHGRQFGVQATTTSANGGALTKTKNVNNDDLFASTYSANPQVLYPSPAAYAVPVPVAYVPVPVSALGASTSRRATTGNLAAPLPQVPASMSMYAPSTHAGHHTARRSTAPTQQQTVVWPDVHTSAQPFANAPLSPSATARYRLPLVANAPASNYSVAETTGHIAIPVPSHLSPVAGASNRKSLAMAVPLELSRYVPIDERDGNNGHFLAAGLGYGPSHRNHFKYRNDNREGRVDLALFRSNHMQ